MMRTYICPKCGTFEDYRNDDKIITKCPECYSKIRQSYGGNFRLVGPGFYSTDKEVRNEC